PAANRNQQCQTQFIFFFSSRRRHTRLQGDWSSDVCSSDLGRRHAAKGLIERHDDLRSRLWTWLISSASLTADERGHLFDFCAMRSEERRVGKECRSRWSP